MSTLSSTIAVLAAAHDSADLYRRYELGQHDLRFATTDFLAKYKDQFMTPAGCIRENMCPAVISACCDDISVETWGDDDEQQAQDYGLPALFDRVTRESHRVGDAWVLVWPDSDGNLQPIYHPGDRMHGVPDPENPSELDHVVKLWWDAETQQHRMWRIDRWNVEAWATVPAASGPGEKSVTTPKPPADMRKWLPASVDDDPDGDSVIAHHSPGKVPVVWFPLDLSDLTGRGVSVLSDVIPLQDGLNKSLASMIVIEEAYARPFRLLLNVPDDKMDMQNPFAPASGAPTPPPMPHNFDPRKQQMFGVTAGGPFYNVDPPDLRPIIQEQQEYRAKIAGVAGVPAFWFTQLGGDIPSGRALERLMARKVARTRRYLRVAEPGWKGVLELLGMDPTGIRFTDPFPPAAEDRASLAESEEAAGYPPEITATTRGYNPGMTVGDSGATLADVLRAAKTLKASDIGYALRTGRDELPPIDEEQQG